MQFVVNCQFLAQSLVNLYCQKEYRHLGVNEALDVTAQKLKFRFLFIFIYQCSIENKRQIDFILTDVNLLFGSHASQ